MAHRRSIIYSRPAVGQLDILTNTTDATEPELDARGQRGRYPPHRHRARQLIAEQQRGDVRDRRVDHVGLEERTKQPRATLDEHGRDAARGVQRPHGLLQVEPARSLGPRWAAHDTHAGFGQFGTLRLADRRRRELRFAAHDRWDVPGRAYELAIEWDVQVRIEHDPHRRCARLAMTHGERRVVGHHRAHAGEDRVDAAAQCVHAAA